MPDDTDARPALNLAGIRKAHDYPTGSWCHTCECEIEPCLTARLVDDLQDARSEIARHHADFAIWQGHAEQGLASLEERRRLRIVAEAAREWRTAYHTMYEAMNRRGGIGSQSREHIRWSKSEMALCAAVDALDAAPDVPEREQR